MSASRLISKNILRRQTSPLAPCLATSRQVLSASRGASSLLSSASTQGRHSFEIPQQQSFNSSLNDRRWFSSEGGGDSGNGDVTSSSIQDSTYDPSIIDDDFQDTSYITAADFEGQDYSHMTNEELLDTSNIPGWDLIHSPPGKLPKGALVGKVVSTKMQKTVNVAVDRYKIHPLYRKRIRYTKKFMAHDELEVANDGDLVMILPCHRISKHKHFVLREIVRAKGQL